MTPPDDDDSPSRGGSSGADDRLRPVDPLRQLFGTVVDDDVLDEIPGATCWSAIGPDGAPAAWADLRAWVEELRRRFAHLDHHVLPVCWWRHNEHVEALVALRDHERASFSDTAPATAPLDWFRALRDVTALLRAWTAEQGCGASHHDGPVRIQPIDEEAWESFVDADADHRRQHSGQQVADRLR